ncbi:hypothetical protein KHA80_12395 [Anaerobacillus sp. HL2]|nr:hypothetical protein KHA80_12395 [Anaerobacillus sp. HL2]
MRAIELIDLSPEERGRTALGYGSSGIESRTFYKVVDEGLHGEGRDTEQVDQLTSLLYHV